MEIRRGSWDGPTIRIEKKRQRMLLGLLVAHAGRALTRDMAIDLLWPDADPAAAVNSLNQTVFQLRRVLDEHYRDGESAQYIVSSVDSVELNQELIRTDLAEFRRIHARRGNASHGGHSDLIALIRGEFLEDLKYEDWATPSQTAVHAEVRSVLLELAAGRASIVDPELCVRAACALIALDPFDEKAHLELARHLADSGKRAAAREAISRYARRVREDFEEMPSDDLAAMLRYVGAANPFVQ
jgi:DNA-binding SARP family transcriptional activator